MLQSPSLGAIPQSQLHAGHVDMPPLLAAICTAVAVAVTVPHATVYWLC